jgi:hypothetical protein
MTVATLVTMTESADMEIGITLHIDLQGAAIRIGTEMTGTDILLIGTEGAEDTATKKIAMEEDLRNTRKFKFKPIVNLDQQKLSHHQFPIQQLVILNYNREITAEMGNLLVQLMVLP